MSVDHLPIINCNELGFLDFFDADGQQMFCASVFGTENCVLRLFITIEDLRSPPSLSGLPSVE